MPGPDETNPKQDPRAESKRDPFDYDGSYLDPPWVFAEGIPSDLVEPALSDRVRAFAIENGTRIASVADVDGREIVITYGSGLFVKATSVVGRPGYDVHARADDRRDAIRVCNLIICELALDDVVVRPFTDNDMCGSLRDGDRASIWAAGGIKGVRAWATQGILDGDNGSLSTSHWGAVDVRLVRRCHPATRALALADFGAQLPDFVASALSSRDWQRPAEAVLFAWIVAEQLINARWKTYVKSVSRNRTHRDRLEDFRTYTAAVQSDTLHSQGTLTDDAADALDRARRTRNQLAHSADLDGAAASDAITAMGYALVELAGITLNGSSESWRAVTSATRAPTT